MTRRLLLAAGLAVALAAALWLLQDDGSTSDTALSRDDWSKDEHTARLLSANAAAGPQAAKGPELTGRPDDLPDRPSRGAVLVRLLGPGGRPLRDVLVECLTSDGSAPKPVHKVSEVRAADVNGEVVFADVPYDGSALVRARVRKDQGIYTISVGASGSFDFMASGSPLPHATAIVRGPEVTLRSRVGLPLFLSVLDASTGLRLRTVRWKAVPEMRMLFDAHHRDSKHAVYVGVAPGQHAAIAVELEGGPAGYAGEMKFQWNVRIHPEAQKLFAVVPRRPEARVSVEFPQVADLPAGAPWRAKFNMASKKWVAVRAALDTFDRWQLRGIPHIPGETVRIAGPWGRFRVSGSGRLPVDERDGLHIRASLSKRTPAKVSARVKRGRALHVQALRALQVQLINGQGLRVKLAHAKANDALQLVHFSAHRLLVQQNGKLPTPPKKRTFDVIVKRRDGTPAQGAEVTIQKKSAVTDAKGVARFENLPAGMHGFGVWGAGASQQGSVIVPASGSGTKRVHTNWGADVHVVIVDEDGNPMPFASLIVRQASGIAWCDVLDGMQRIDPYVDDRGRRTLHNVEAGKTVITALLGTRGRNVEIDVPESGSTRVRIVLPTAPLPAQPKPKPAQKKR